MNSPPRTRASVGPEGRTERSKHKKANIRRWLAGSERSEGPVFGALSDDPTWHRPPRTTASVGPQPGGLTNKSGPAARRAAKQERQGRRDAATPYEALKKAPDQPPRMNSPPRTTASVGPQPGGLTTRAARTPQGRTERSNQLPCVRHVSGGPTSNPGFPSGPRPHRRHCPGGDGVWMSCEHALYVRGTAGRPHGAAF